MKQKLYVYLLNHSRLFVLLKPFNTAAFRQRFKVNLTLKTRRVPKFRYAIPLVNDCGLSNYVVLDTKAQNAIAVYSYLLTNRVEILLPMIETTYNKSKSLRYNGLEQ